MAEKFLRLWHAKKEGRRGGAARRKGLEDGRWNCGEGNVRNRKAGEMQMESRERRVSAAKGSGKKQSEFTHHKSPELFVGLITVHN